MAEWQKRYEELVRQNAEEINRKDGELNEMRRLTENRDGASRSAGQRTALGFLNEFSMGDDWNIWYERFEQFVDTNDVGETKKVGLFLTLLGNDGYKLIRSLSTPHLPKTKSLNDLQTIMSQHLKPKPSIITERFKFKECRKKSEQSINQFVANLKFLATDCEFEGSLDDAMRDQFVWGLREVSIQRKLLGEKNLTYVRALEIACGMEAARKDTGEMNRSEAIHFVKDHRHQKDGSQWREPQRKNSCNCCSRVGHQWFKCHFREYKCDNCGIKGHLKAMCNEHRKRQMKNGDNNG